MTNKILYKSRLLFLGMVSLSLQAHNNGVITYSDFLNPSQETRPRVWWHWLNGNITQDGIRKDIEWMHNVDIGGAHVFDGNMGTPVLVKDRISNMSPEWKACFRLATSLFSSNGMEEAIASSPGWSEAGGPWVKPKDAMKKITWRETYVRGGKTVKIKLPEPFTMTSDFQNVRLNTHNVDIETKFYKDIVVLACKTEDESMAQMKAQITASNGTFTLDQLSNTDLSDFQKLTIEKNTPASYINVTFPQAQIIKAISLTTDAQRESWAIKPANCNHCLEYSQDGTNWTWLCDIPDGGVYQQTVSFPAIKARFFRVAFRDPNGKSTRKTSVKISELVLHSASYINHFEDKAGYYTAYDTDEFTTPEEQGVKEVVDITKYMDINGNLIWKAPKGNWKILRIGYNLTGHENAPVTRDEQGLEVDKMDSAAVKTYIEHYLYLFQEASGNRLGKDGVSYLLNDSYEAGQNTWTETLPEEFEKRRGYSLWKYLPVLTGITVDNTDKSEAFLWDWRKTIGELVVENYYEQLDKALKKHGMKRYSESHENGRVYLADGMEVKRHADIPMGAMWIPKYNFGTSQKIGEADIRESASVAHLYGQKYIAGESFTTIGMNDAYAFGPSELRPTADLEFASGLNRIVIHESAHQAVETVPGITMSAIGTWFNRHITWADQAKAWVDYLARTSYMMQQGRNVADIAWYYGENNNVTGLVMTDTPTIPKGYNFDYINSDALLHVLDAKDNRLISNITGNSYSILAIDRNATHMSMGVLRKLDELSKAGITICGYKPKVKSGMEGSDNQFQQLADTIWSRPNVVEGLNLEATLAKINVFPDFQTTTDSILYVHHTTDNGEFYWIDNRRNQKVDTRITLRTSNGIQPQIWRAAHGTREQVTAKASSSNTEMAVTLNPHESYFIVFDKDTPAADASIDMSKQSEVFSLNNPWTVIFQEHRGAPAQTTLEHLASLSENTDPAIKYFSGTAIYTTTFKVSKKQLKTYRNFFLNLGKVSNIAEVFLNGQPLGTYWETPFLIPAGNTLQAGNNTLTVKVTNFWTNRLIGDQQESVKKKITTTSMDFYSAGATLLPSGLIGPVKISAESK
mgnify:CR=1 FL=1